MPYRSSLDLAVKKGDFNNMVKNNNLRRKKKRMKNEFSQKRFRVSERPRILLTRGLRRTFTRTQKISKFRQILQRRRRNG